MCFSLLHHRDNFGGSLIIGWLCTWTIQTSALHHSRILSAGRGEICCLMFYACGGHNQIESEGEMQPRPKNCLGIHSFVGVKTLNNNIGSPVQFEDIIHNEPATVVGLFQRLSTFFHQVIDRKVAINQKNYYQV